VLRRNSVHDPSEPEEKGDRAELGVSSISPKEKETTEKAALRKGKKSAQQNGGKKKLTRYGREEACLKSHSRTENTPHGANCIPPKKAHWGRRNRDIEKDEASSRGRARKKNFYFPRAEEGRDDETGRPNRGNLGKKFSHKKSSP